jgi:tetratricopeptide (TPR) repeat protein
MNILDQLRQWLGLRTITIVQPENTPLREALEAGQRASHAEDYPRAMEAFNRAMSIATNSKDVTAMAVAALNKANVLMEQREWAKAEELLQDAYRLTRSGNQRGAMAYVVNALGLWEQQQGRWDAARAYYEQALQAGREGRALGAEARAQGHLAATYLHEQNASYALHLLREALPKLNAARDLELSSYFVGLMGQAFLASGQTADGQQMLDRALRLAKQMGYRKYERRWHLALGDYFAANDLHADARTHFQAAVDLFKPDSGSAEFAAALCNLSRACFMLRDNEAALTHARRAFALSETLQDDSLTHRARSALGSALQATGHLAEAMQHRQASAALASSSDQAAEIHNWRYLAGMQADTGHLDEAIATYREAIEQAERWGQRLPLAHTRRDLGLLLARQRRIPEALQEWTAALAIYEAEKQPAQIARLYCDMATARKYLGQGQRAMKDYEQALMTLNALNGDWETRGLVLSNAANAYAEQGDMDSADSFFNEAIAIARRLGDEAAETTRRGNYGWFLISIGRPQQAIAALEYALRLSSTLQLELQAAIQTDNLGLAYDLMGNYLRALDYHHQALERSRPLNDPHWEHIFKANLAMTLLSLGHQDEAQPLLDEALAAGRQTEDLELTVRSLNGLGRLHLRQGQPDLAGPLLDEAGVLARRADMRRLLAESLALASEYQAMTGDHTRAAETWREAHKYFTMLHNPQAKTQPAWLHNAPANSVR